MSRKPVIGVVLHIHYEDVGHDILRRLTQLERPLRLFITNSDKITAGLTDRAYNLAGDHYWQSVPNRGRDVEPFLSVLPLLGECDYVVKLHTKNMSTPVGRAWYLEMVEALIDSPAAFDAIVDTFESDPAVQMIGPKITWLSAQHFMYENAAIVAALKKAVAGYEDPSDWGFFAGTMFWFRRGTFDALEAVWRETLRFEFGRQGIVPKDGHPEHAVERFFGYPPHIAHAKIGLASKTKAGPLIEFGLPPSKTAISKMLTAKHKLRV